MFFSFCFIGVGWSAVFIYGTINVAFVYLFIHEDRINSATVAGIPLSVYMSSQFLFILYLLYST